MKVKLTKISATENPKYPTPDSKSYEYGQLNEKVSIPNDYWVIGELINPIKVGTCVCVARENRNGVQAEGLFRTSTVKCIGENIFETANSKYKVEYLD